MTLTVKTLKSARFRETMVMLPLRQYDELMEYLEDMEDRLSVMEKADEPEYDFNKLVKRLDKKHGVKRNLR